MPVTLALCVNNWTIIIIIIIIKELI